MYVFECRYFQSVFLTCLFLIIYNQLILNIPSHYLVVVVAIRHILYSLLSILLEQEATSEERRSEVEFPKCIHKYILSLRFDTFSSRVQPFFSRRNTRNESAEENPIFPSPKYIKRSPTNSTP